MWRDFISLKEHGIPMHAFLLAAIAYAGIFTIALIGNVALDYGLIIFYITFSAILLAIAIYFADRHPQWRAAGMIGFFGTFILVTKALGLFSVLGATLNWPLVDTAIARADEAVGINHPAILRYLADAQSLSHVLDWFYNHSREGVILVGLSLAFAQKRERLYNYTSIYVMALFVTVGVSPFIPSMGTYTHYAIPADVIGRLPMGSGTFYLETFHMLRNGRFEYLGPHDINGIVGFPSFHCVIALLIAYGLHVFPFIRWFGYVTAVVTIIATVPIGGHFGMDVVAGGLLFVACWKLTTSGLPRLAFLRTFLPEHLKPAMH
jgi:membrane-associated phospholipid phosphatase